MLSSRLFPPFSVLFSRWYVDRRLLRVRICKFVTHPDGKKAICQWQTNWYRFSEIIIRVYPLHPRRWYIIWLFFVEVSINTRRSQNLKDGHLTNAKNQILIISENCMGRHLQNGSPCETIMFKLDAYRRKINLSAYSINADTSQTISIKLKRKVELEASLSISECKTKKSVKSSKIPF